MTTRRFVQLLVVVLAATVVGPITVAIAGPNDDSKARDIYLEGEAHYAAGRYEEAAKAFQEAHALSKRPQLLFNIANAYERMGRYDEAADYLRRYLNSPKATGVVSVRQRIKRLEMQVEREREERERLAREREERERRDRENEDREDLIDDGTGGESEGGSKAPGYLFLAGGGVALAGAAAFGLAASSAGDDASALCSPSGLCPDAAKSDLDREKTFALLADISAGVGIVSVGVGVYLLISSGGSDEPERKNRSRSVHVAPTVLPGGVGVGLAGDF